MTDNSRKYLDKREGDHPALGNFVHWFIKQQNVLKKDVAKDLQIIPVTLNRYFKQHSLQFGILWRISRAINYNMIMDLGERMDIPYETKAEKKLKDELAEKNEQIKELEMQMKVYEKMVRGDIKEIS